MSNLNDEEQIKDKMRFLLEDTMEAYNSQNRSVSYYEDDEGNPTKEEMECIYRSDDGRKCAIGRWFPEDNDIFESIIKGNRGIDVLTKKELEALYSIEEFNGVSESFLKAIQDLHDVPENWDLNGLTLRGREKSQDIIKEFSL